MSARAALLLLVAVLGVGGCGERTAGSGADAAAPSASEMVDPAPDAELAELEQRSGGRLGVALVDARGRMLLSHRADERFAMCSTFKLPLAAMLLAEAASGRVDAARVVPFRVADLPPHSPGLQAAARDGTGRISLIDAARAGVVLSDNGAANILLDALGGPAAFTNWMAGSGGGIRLDRIEPALNENAHGDPRDTATPLAMARFVRDATGGNLLRPDDAAKLMQWSVESRTGMARIRAGLPAGFVAGDKTGSCGGDNPSFNDVAWLRPQGATPARNSVLAVFLDRPSVPAEEANAIIADVARIAARHISADTAP